MKRSTRSAITIEIIGGLGNQLFAYFAGLYISNILRSPLRVFIRPLASGESSHSSTIKSFAFGSGVITRMSIPERVSLLVRKNLRMIFIRIGLTRKLTESLSRYHVSNTIGEDQELLESKPGYYLSGYFQTYEYFRYLKTNNLAPAFTLNSPSEWFNKESKRILEAKPIAVHIRRGDYLLDKNRFIGALSAKYYKNAIYAARHHLGDLGEKEQSPPIWIFTDSQELVEKEMSPFFEGTFKIVSPPKNADPAESMVLMSLARSVVISNSTFSWWAAVLGSAQVIVAPSKWFQGHEDPKGLIPENWIKIRSEWIS